MIRVYIYISTGSIGDGSRGADLVLTELFFESDYPQSHWHGRLLFAALRVT